MLLLEEDILNALPKTKHRIVVAMSGGIDSSCVAAILNHLGHEVIGITLQLYDYSEVAKKGACCAGQDIYDAKEVCDNIGIEHYVLNYESKFKQKVIDNFIDGYLKGQTPIPCIQCNMSVKFTDLIKFAKDLKADFLATGHYVQRKTVDNKNGLYKALDHRKDQSYYLFNTTQDQLDYLLFPLGGVSKERTRELAKFFGIKIHNKPDSQDICFIPNKDYASTIEKYRPEAIKPGDILHVEGFKIGEHQGIHRFTIGQRKGIGINFKYPLYVVKIDPNNNTVFVGPEDALNSQIFNITGVNLLEDLSEKEEYLVRLRSLHPGSYAKISPAKENEYEVKLLDPQKAICPGQACVIYKDDRILGGGWIC